MSSARFDRYAGLSFLAGVVASEAGYDWAGLLRYAIRSKRNNRNNWFCSELAVAAFRAGGVELVPRTQMGMVAPADVYRSAVLHRLATITIRDIDA